MNRAVGTTAAVVDEIDPLLAVDEAVHRLADADVLPGAVAAFLEVHHRVEAEEAGGEIDDVGVLRLVELADQAVYLGVVRQPLLNLVAAEGGLLSSDVLEVSDGAAFEVGHALLRLPVVRELLVGVLGVEGVVGELVGAAADRGCGRSEAASPSG